MKLCRDLTFGMAMLLPFAPSMFDAKASASSVVVSVEAPGVQQSSVSGVLTETFDSLSLGSKTTIASAIGTYSATAPGGMIVAPNAFGGSYETQYLAVGAQSSPTTVVTLDLAGPSTYFGFFLGAIDNQNRIDIYDGATLLSTIDRASILPMLGGNSAYYGNPNNGQNTGEPYVYINVAANSGSFNRVVFRNIGTGTGLETDNHSVRAVPEPSSLAIAGLGLLSASGLAFPKRLRARSQTN